MVIFRNMLTIKCISWKQFVPGQLSRQNISCNPIWRRFSSYCFYFLSMEVDEQSPVRCTRQTLVHGCDWPAGEMSSPPRSPHTHVRRDGTIGVAIWRLSQKLKPLIFSWDTHSSDHVCSTSVYQKLRVRGVFFRSHQPNDPPPHFTLNPAERL
jgi:hypothetical protein